LRDCAIFFARFSGSEKKRNDATQIGVLNSFCILAFFSFFRKNASMQKGCLGGLAVLSVI
jgi:hypothetical protein